MHTWTSVADPGDPLPQLFARSGEFVLRIDATGKTAPVSVAGTLNSPLKNPSLAVRLAARRPGSPTFETTRTEIVLRREGEVPPGADEQERLTALTGAKVGEAVDRLKRYAAEAFPAGAADSFAAEVLADKLFSRRTA